MALAECQGHFAVIQPVRLRQGLNGNTQTDSDGDTQTRFRWSAGTGEVNEHVLRQREGRTFRTFHFTHLTA